MSKKTIEELFNYKGAKLSGNSLVFEFEPKEVVPPVEEPIFHEPFEIKKFDPKTGFVNFYSVGLKDIFWHFHKVVGTSATGEPVVDSAYSLSGHILGLTKDTFTIDNLDSLSPGKYEARFVGNGETEWTRVVKLPIFEVKAPDVPAEPPEEEPVLTLTKIDITNIDKTPKVGDRVRFQFHSTGVEYPFVALDYPGGEFYSWERSKDLPVQPNNWIETDLVYKTPGPVTISVGAFDTGARTFDGDALMVEVQGLPVDPPIDPPVETGTGILAKTDRRWLNIEYKKHPSDAGFLISDASTEKAPNGYEWWWTFNEGAGGVVFKGQELKDFHWKGDGALSIRKRCYKIGLDSEWRWNNVNQPDGSWYDNNAGHGKSYQSGIATLGGQVELFLTRDETIPSWKGLNVAPQWSKLAPPMKLPEGKAMHFHISGVWDGGPGYPHSKFEKGETHVRDWGSYSPSLPDHLQADHTIGLAILGVTGPTDERGEFNGDVSILERAGENWPARGITFLETAEGRCWVPHLGHKFQALLRGRKKRYEREGRFDSSFVGGCYGEVSFSGVNLYSAKEKGKLEEVKQLFSRSESEVVNYYQLFRERKGLANTLNIKYYGQIAGQESGWMDIIYQFMVGKKAGFKVLGYPGNLTEIVDVRAFGGGYNWETELPNGGVSITTHIARPSWLEGFNFGFISMLFGNGFYLWDAGGKVSDNPDFPEKWEGEYIKGWETYYRDGGKDPGSAPDGGRYPSVSMHFYDALYSGVQRYMDFSETEGGEIAFVEHGLGTSYYRNIDPKADMIDAYAEKRGVAFIREKNGVKHLFYFNPFLGNERKTLNVNGFKPREVFSGRIYGFKD